MTDLTPDASSVIPPALQSAQGLDLNQFEAIRTPVQSWTTEGASRVRFVEARGLPMVDLILRFNAGTTQDTDLPGVAALTLHMLSEGAKGMDASTLATRLEGLGALTGKTVLLEHATLQLRTLSEPHVLEEAIGLFVDGIAQPDFPEPALAKVKDQWNAFSQGRQAFHALKPRFEVYRHLFANHPYGLPEGSTAQGIAAITVDDLREFHRKAYAASNLDMVIIGDLSHSAAVALSERVSQALPQGWSAAQLPSAVPADSATLHLEHDAASTEVMLALPLSLPASEPEYLALELANEVLGSGLDSRLAQALRQRHGLTYSVTSTLKPLSVSGLFTVQWNVGHEYRQASVDEVLAQLQRFIEEGPDASELQLARQKLAGRLLRDVSMNATLGQRLLDMGSRQLPDDYLSTFTERLAELTPELVREIVKTRLDLTQKVIVSVGKTVAQQNLAEPPPSSR